MNDAAKTIDQKTIFFDALNGHLPADEVDRIRADAKRRLAEMYEEYPDLPKGVGMHVYNFILPAAAIYLAIKAENEDIAYAVMEKCMREKSSKTGEGLHKMSHVPGFNRFFMHVWDPVSHKMFGPDAGFENVFYEMEKNEYRMDILACPYQHYLTAVGCPELTVLFCKNDEYSYGNMDGLHFIRTQTLGSGGEKCDFKLVLDDNSEDKPSLQYRMVERLFKTLNVKNMLAAEGEDFEKLLEKYDKEQQKPLKIPVKKLRPKFEIIKKDIDGTTVYGVRLAGTKPKNAVLYLFGGGYILPPDPGDIELCAEIAEHADAEVYFPLYPMAPSHRLIETLESSRKVYEEILKRFKAENVRFFGTSSGGGQCLSLCMYMDHDFPEMPLPGKLVLQSPGLEVPPSEAQKARMAELSGKDIMIPPAFFDNIAPVLASGDEAYLLSPILYDLTGFPPIDIWYGTNEVMYAYLPDMQAACEKCGVPLNVHIGEGMMHCWGAMSFVPEAQAVRREYFEALK